MMIEKEMIMKGSIRAILGLLVVFGAAGGLDTATDAQLPTVLVIAAVGLFIVYSGVTAMKGSK
jgi:hypothetical protein